MVWTLLLLLWGWRAVTEREPLSIFMAALAVVAVAVHTWVYFTEPRTRLLLRDEELELRRRFRPLPVVRADVVAVRGDVPDRPTWSDHVLIETRDRTVRLPLLDRPAGELIPRLQNWAGVGEHPAG